MAAMRWVPDSIPDFISDEHYLAMHQTVDISF